MQFDEFINKVGEDKLREIAAEGNASELVSLMQEEGVELTDEMLEGVAGGTFLLFPNILDFFQSEDTYRHFMQSFRQGVAIF